MLCFASSSGVSGAHLVVKWSVHEMLSFVYVIFSSGVSRAHLAVQWSVRVQCWFRTCHIFYECYSSTPRVKVKISWKVVFRTCHIFVGSYYLKIMMMFVLPSTVHLHSYVEYDLLICRHWQLNGGLIRDHLGYNVSTQPIDEIESISSYCDSFWWLSVSLVVTWRLVFL